MRAEWRLANGEGTTVTVIGEGEAWTFELPPRFNRWRFSGERT